MAKSTKGKSLFGIIGGVFGGGKAVSKEEIKEAEAATRRDPNSLRKQHKLADIYAKANQIGKAIDTYLKLADEYIVREFFPQAIAVYKQVLKLNPNAYDVRLKLSEVYNDTGRRSDALSTLQELALRYESTGAVRIAGEVFAKMIEIDPDNIPLRIKLAELYLRVSERQSAIYEFEKALRKIGEKEHWSDYIKVGERLLFVAPDHLHTLKMVSRLYLDANNPMKAIAKLQTAFKINRRDADTLELLAIAFEKLEQPAKTISVLEELGDVYVEQENLDHASEVYQQLLEYDPGNEHYQSILNNINAQVPEAGSASESQTVAEEKEKEVASASSEADLEKILSDAEVYLKYGMQDRVLEALQQILEAQPKHLRALKLRSDAYLALNQSQLAALDLLTLAQQAAPNEASDYLDKLLALENVSADVTQEARGLLAQINPSKAASGTEPDPNLTPTHENDAFQESDSQELYHSVHDLEIAPPSMISMTPPSVIALPPAEEPPSSEPALPVETNLDIPAVEESTEAVEDIDIIDVSDDDIIVFDDAGNDDIIVLDDVDDDIIVIDDEESQELSAAAPPVIAMPPPAPRQPHTEQAPKALANLSPPPGLVVSPPEPPPAAPPTEPSLSPLAPPPPLAPAEDDPFAQALQRANSHTSTEEEDEQDYAFLDNPVVVEQPEKEAPLSEMEAAAARLQALIAAKENDTTEAIEASAPELPPAPFAKADSEIPDAVFNAPSVELSVDLSESEASLDSPSSPQVEREEQTAPRSDSSPATPNKKPKFASYKPITAQSEDETQVTDSLVLQALNDDSPFVEEFEQAFRYTEQEEHQYALDLYRQILAKDPTNEVARQGEQESLAALEAQEESIDDLFAGLDLDSVLGTSSEKERDRAAQDIADFASAVKKEIGVEEGETHFDLGLAYHGMGLYVQALDAFQTCIEGGYRLLDAHKMIGHCYGSQGQLQDALTSYKKALQIPEITTEERLDTLYEIGLTCEQSERYAIALQYFEEVALLDDGYRKVQQKLQKLKTML